MKQQQQHVMQNVRQTGVPHVRPGVQYNNQTMQQQPTSQQQQQGQPSQMPVGYMNDPSSMMMSSAGANSIPQNANRPPGAATSGKRKLNETTMYANEQPQYTTPAKMPLQSAGKILLDKKRKLHFTCYSWFNGTISTKSSNDVTE